MRLTSIYPQHLVSPPTAANDNREPGSGNPTDRRPVGAWIEIRVVHTETIRRRDVVVRAGLDVASTEG